MPMTNTGIASVIEDGQLPIHSKPTRFLARLSPRRGRASGTARKSLLAVLLVLGCAVPAFAAASATAALERLAALPENHGLVLGRAQVLGEFNDTARRFDLHRTGPRSRDYSIKMVWAPDRKSALFAGANHRVPHRLNDVWEFDLAAMAWKLLYAPDNSRSYLGLGEDASDVVYRDGLLVTRRGGPAVIGHTWWGITYDPEQRRLLYMNTWATKQDEVVRELGGDPAERFRGPPLWSFDPAAGTWQFVRTPEPWPKILPGAMLEYVPELGGAIWHMNNWQMRKTWLFRADEQRWEDLRAKGFPGEAPGRELVGYYDPQRRIVVAHWKRNTFHFDPRMRQWSQTVEAAKDDESVPHGYDARTAFHFDPASGHGLLVNLRAKEIWSYDPDRATWSHLSPEGAPMPTGSRLLSYVDPLRNALVVIDDTTVWAYRYRAARPGGGVAPNGRD